MILIAIVTCFLLFCNLHIWFQSLSTELMSIRPQNAKWVEVESWMWLHWDFQSNVHVAFLKHPNEDWSFFLLKKSYMFDKILTFQKWFVSFPNKNIHRTDCKCRPQWLDDEEMFSL